jgi:hypothetical protein
MTAEKTPVIQYGKNPDRRGYHCALHLRTLASTLARVP